MAAEYISNARSALAAPPVGWITRRHAGRMENLDAALDAAGLPLQIPNGEQVLICADKAFYIFTSGTTGLPKAANVSHLRTLFMMHGFAGALGAARRTACTMFLPLYPFVRAASARWAWRSPAAAPSCCAGNSRCMNSGTIACATGPPSSSISAKSAAIFSMLPRRRANATIVFAPSSARN